MQIFLPYYIALFILAISVLVISKGEVDNKVSLFIGAIIIGFYVIFVASRNEDHPGDTFVYLRIFDFVSNNRNFLDGFRVEPGILVVNKIISFFTHSHRDYLIAIALLQSFLWLLLFSLFLKKSEIIVAVFTFISMFMFYNLGMNVLRQGIAIPLALIAILTMHNRKIVLGGLVFLLSLFFHKSVIILLFCYMLTKANLKARITITVWVAFSLLSFLGFLDFIKDFISVGDDYSHLTTEYAMDKYKTGFRLDFWVFSFLFLVIAWWGVKESKSTKAKLVFDMYVYSNIIFIILFSIPYSDRIGLFSWCLIPFILSQVIFLRGEVNFKMQIVVTAFIFLFGFLMFSFYPIMNSNHYISDFL